MAEKIRFPSPEEKRERQTFEALKGAKGILYREGVDPETKEIKKFINILGVEVETYASEEDIEAIKEEIVLSETDQKMLRTIAECYKLRQPLLLEGDPGTGKTFLMKKFVQLIHGKDAPILEIVGTPRTSELEILGHWAPASKERKSEDPVVQDAIQRYNKLEAEYQKVNDEFDTQYRKINDEIKEGKITQEEANKRLEELLKWSKPLQERYASELQSLMQRITLTEKKVEWEFKEGALLQAYSGREGRGYILIVDEFNLIPSNYQQIFLQIGGERGALSDSISFWGNTGKTRYARGKDTWICFASNYPEKTPGRSEVVAPMTDRLVWITITPEEVEEKKRVVIISLGGRHKETTPLVPEIVSVPVEKGLAWDKVLNEQLGEQIGEIVYLFDEEFVKIYQEVGDKITKEGGGRTQQFEFSVRNSLRVFDYLDHFQVRNPKTGRIDFVQTLKNAFELYYIGRLVSKEARERMREFLQELLEPKNMEAIRGPEEILEAKGKSLPPGAVIFEGKIVSRKELLDILVERASMTKKEKKRLEEEKKREEERKLKQAQFDAQDAIDSLLRHPKIPKHIKESLREIFKRIIYPMPESFEQHFPKQPEGPKSLEKIKEEEGLALVREIKEIQKRMEEERKTTEGYQRITKLAQEIKKLYEGKERDFEAEVKTIVANLEKALKEGANKDYVARGLAGVGTKEAMELRERLLKEGADKNDVAYGLAGVGTKEAMELRERLLKEGANKNYVALGLAGVGTKEAMALRERLLKEGADKHYVTLGLAGVGTKEAMALRERLLKEGANKNDVALGLAGVGTKEAMELRERLLKEGADKDYVAWGLAGVGTKEAMALRERLLEKRASKDYVALGLAGVGTKEAMALRERLLEKRASKDYVAQGLAGVGTKEAMALRERLLKEGANKDYVAWSLAGVNTEEAEEFRRKHFADNPTLIAKSYSTGLTVCNGIICRYGYEE